MAKFNNKVSNHISRQLPEFVLEEHPVFVDFLKAVFYFYGICYDSFERHIINRWFNNRN